MNAKRNMGLALALAAAGTVSWGTAQAEGILSNGTVALGVADLGELNVGGTTTIYGPSFTSPGSGTVPGTGVRGLFVNGTSGFEATFPGCLCEGWGAGVADAGGTGLFQGNADKSTGFSNVTFVSATFGTDGAGNGIGTTVTTIADATGAPALRVTHDFHTSASSFLYQVDVTVENISGQDLGAGASGLRYTRLMDFDTEPTAFSEFITIQGHPAANLLHTSDDGFEVPNPFFATSSISGCAPVDSNFTDCGPADHGARFDFGFDALLGADNPATTDVNETLRTFTIFYGAAPTEAAADLARATVGAEVYAYGQCNPAINTSCSTSAGTPITYIFGFKGVGGTAPPPPGTAVPEIDAVAGTGALTLLAGALALAGERRRRKTVDASE